MYQSWADLDRATDGLTPEGATARLDGFSSIGWTVAHVTQMADSWFNARFQGLPPHPLISNPDFRTGGSGDAKDWPAIQRAAVGVRECARRFLDALTDADLERVIPYDGSIKFLRPTGLRLSYAILRISAHTGYTKGKS